jgi:hypothetical protein
MLHPTEDFIMKHRYFATEYIAEYKGDAGPLRSTPYHIRQRIRARSKIVTH